MIESSLIWSFEYLVGQWRPTIGDPTIMGWFTVASYFLCALMALSLAYRDRSDDRKSFSFWLVIGMIMILLGINKQLDLQSLLTEIGRQIARAQGWMDQRRVVQLVFIVIFTSASMTAFVWLTAKFRDVLKRFLLAFSGLFFLLSFIIIRAASFHHVEEMLDFRLVGVRMNWIFELTGIYLILAAGFKETILATMRKD